MWVLPTYQASVADLVQEAMDYDGSEQEIPSLLQFINMIINDATLQLDEGLEVWGMGVWGMEKWGSGGMEYGKCVYRKLWGIVCWNGVLGEWKYELWDMTNHRCVL